MILDIIIIAIILLFMIIGLKRGIAKTLYGVIILAAAGILAYLGGKLIAGFIYDNYILSSITKSVTSAFDASKVTTKAVSTDVFDSIPSFLTSILIGMGITQNGFSTSLGNASEFSKTATLGLVDKIIKPILVSTLSVFVIAALFIILILIFKLIGRHILKLFRLPVIRWFNALAGGIFGLAEGALIVLLFIVIIRLLASFTNDFFITKELIDSSYLFKMVYNWDFLRMIFNFNIVK